MSKMEVLAKIAELESFTEFDGPELHDILDTIKEANSAVFLGHCLQAALMNGRKQSWKRIQRLAKSGIENCEAYSDLLTI